MKNPPSLSFAIACFIALVPFSLAFPSGENFAEQGREAREQESMNNERARDNTADAREEMGAALPIETQEGADLSTGLKNLSLTGVQKEQVLAPKERLRLLIEAATKVGDSEQIKKCNNIRQKYEEIEVLREMEENKRRPKAYALQFSWLESMCAPAEPAKEPSEKKIVSFNTLRRSTLASADSMVKKLEVEKESPWTAKKYQQLAEAYDNSITLLMRAWQEEEAQQQQSVMNSLLYYNNNAIDVDSLYQAGVLQWRSARIQQLILEELEGKLLNSGKGSVDDQNETKQCYEKAIQSAEEARDYFLKAYDEPKNSMDKVGLSNVAKLLGYFSSIKLEKVINQKNHQADFYSNLESTLQDAIHAGKMAVEQQCADNRGAIYMNRLKSYSWLSVSLLNQAILEHNIESLKNVKYDLSAKEGELLMFYQNLLEKNRKATSFYQQALDDLEFRGGGNFNFLFRQGEKGGSEIRAALGEKKVYLRIKSPFSNEGVNICESTQS